MKIQRKKNKGIFFLFVIFLCYSLRFSVVNAVSDAAATVSNSAITANDNKTTVDDNRADEKIASGAALTIEVPVDISFVLDPFELEGKGQIYSSTFDIINKSNVDVEIEISHIKYIFTDNSDCKASGVPINTMAPSAAKDIYLFLNWVNHSQYGENRELFSDFNSSHVAEESDIVITADEVSPSTFQLKATQKEETGKQVMKPNSKISFCLDGSINPNPSKPWKQGDVKVELVYTCRALETLNAEMESVFGKENPDGSVSGSGISDNSIPNNTESDNSVPDGDVVSGSAITDIQGKDNSITDQQQGVTSLDKMTEESSPEQLSTKEKESENDSLISHRVIRDKYSEREIHV